MKLGEIFQKLTAASERSLILRAKKGNQDAFGKLYKTYLNQIFRYIYFKTDGDVYTAEDLTEEVFVKVMRNLDKYKFENGTFKSWIYAVARNQTIDFMRTKKKFVPLSENIESREDITENLIKKESIDYIKSALGKLSRLQREVLTLSYINGLKNSEICLLIKKSDAEVRAIKHRGLKNLRVELANFNQNNKHGKI